MALKCFLGICLVTIATLGNIVWSRPDPSQSTNQRAQWKDPTTLRSRVEKEKAKGNRRVEFPAPVIEYAEETDLEEVIAKTTVVLADVLEKHSRQVDPGNIFTFYRLGVIETLSQPTTPPCCNPKEEDFPTDLPSLGSNEIYFAGVGGTITLDDVELTVTEDYRELRPNGRYLLFLSTTESGKFSIGKLGPRAVFKVSGDGRLESHLRSLKFGSELQSKAGNSLSGLRSEIRRQKHSIKQ